MQGVRRGNVYLLNCFVGDSAHLIFSFAGREYDVMVSCKKGDTSSSRVFKRSIESYMGYVRDGSKPGETNSRNNVQPEEHLLANNLRCGPG